jgi:hypothetical protein
LQDKIPLLSKHEKIKTITVLVYSDRARIAAEMLMQLPTHQHWNPGIFSNREQALSWLQKQLAQG